jgi:hypothetical protein
MHRRCIKNLHDCHNSWLPCDLNCTCECLDCEELRLDLEWHEEHGEHGDDEAVSITATLPDLRPLVASLAPAPKLSPLEQALAAEFAELEEAAE